MFTVMQKYLDEKKQIMVQDSSSESEDEDCLCVVCCLYSWNQLWEKSGFNVFLARDGSI